MNSQISRYFAACNFSIWSKLLGIVSSWLTSRNAAACHVTKRPDGHTKTTSAKNAVLNFGFYGVEIQSEPGTSVNRSAPVFSGRDEIARRSGMLRRVP